MWVGTDDAEMPSLTSEVRLSQRTHTKRAAVATNMYLLLQTHVFTTMAEFDICGIKTVLPMANSYKHVILPFPIVGQSLNSSRESIEQLNTIP